MSYSIPTVGVEEEYQLVDPCSGALLPNSAKVMSTLKETDSSGDPDATIHHELHLNQIEMASNVCASLAEVRQVLTETRRVLMEAARVNGCRLSAAGTNPLSLPDGPDVTPKERYQAMSHRFQQLARDLFIFGCHVHVAMEDRELGVGVMNRCRRWLPVLQAITANSPYWDGVDTGYASYRRELWAQWPMAGPPPHFRSLDDYQECVDQLIQCGAIKDESFIYWDIRLPTKVPTIEFRAADVMTRVDEAVGYVGLVRAMVMQAIADERTEKPYVEIHQNVLSYATWHAARYGVTDDLVDPTECQRLPARDLIKRTMTELSDVLDATNERQPVDDFINRVVHEGSGAERQRRMNGSSQQLNGMVQDLVAQTGQK